MPTNDGELGKAVSHVDPKPALDGEHPGYETTDVNVSGVVVFLTGLMAFLVVFFVVCFGLGKVINGQLASLDGPTDKWHSTSSFAGDGKREDLTSNAVMQKRAADQMAAFPTPRLDTDDGNQATADLHAREDLLLNHYSSNNGTVRIPIERAMELIAEKGLPVVATSGAPTTLMAGDSHPAPQMPLTSGFARTGYELETIEARAQKMSFAKAEAETHAELRPVK